MTTRKLRSTSEDLVQANMEALSSLEESFSRTRWHASIRTGDDTTAPLVSVSLPAAGDSFKIAEMKPDNCWKPTVWRSVEAADRWPTGMSVIKRTGRESVPGQNSSDQGTAAPL